MTSLQNPVLNKKKPFICIFEKTKKITLSLLLNQLRWLWLSYIWNLQTSILLKTQFNSFFSLFPSKSGPTVRSWAKAAGGAWRHFTTSPPRSSPSTSSRRTSSASPSSAPSRSLLKDWTLTGMQTPPSQCRRLTFLLNRSRPKLSWTVRQTSARTAKTPVRKIPMLTRTEANRRQSISWKDDFHRIWSEARTNRKKPIRLTALIYSTLRIRNFPDFPIPDFRNRNRRSYLASRNRRDLRSQIL